MVSVRWIALQNGNRRTMSKRREGGGRGKEVHSAERREERGRDGTFISLSLLPQLERGRAFN